MLKEDIVQSLKEMADLLEILEASRFEYMAFRNAASALDDWEGDIETAAHEGTVTDIPTIGKGTAKVITELVTKDNSSDLQSVRARVPEKLPALLRFRGLGPKRVRTLWKELNIESIEDLQQAINDGSVAQLKGFGAKTVESMQSSIDYYQSEQRPIKSDNKAKEIPVSITSSGKVISGTSGYSYPAWKGCFYPDKCKTADLLEHYSALLPAVEINNTFYRFPSEQVVEQWKSQTPDGFQFSLKAHRRITHQARLNDNTRKNIREFVERCSILGARLGCILFQLPPDFERDDSKLNNLLSSLPAGPRYAIEFRNNSWHHRSVYMQLTQNNIACVSGDSEKDKPIKLVTADFVYARLRKSNYTASELDAWNDWFKGQQQSNVDVLVFLKHDETGVAPNTIRQLWCNDG